MSLTGNDHLYAMLHENGANDFMQAFYSQRQRNFTLGSFPFVWPATTTASVTCFNPLLNLVPWHAHFTLPRIDFFKTVVPPSSSLYPAAVVDRFHVRTQLTLQLIIPPLPPNQPLPQLITVPLDLAAVARPVVHPGAGTMGLHVVDTEILPAIPQLGPLLNALATFLLNLALAGFTLPYPSFVAGAFKPTITTGPAIDLNELTFQGIL